MTSIFAVPPTSVVVRKPGDSAVGGSEVVSGSAGDSLVLECEARGGNPAPELRWSLGGEEVMAREAQQDKRGEDGRWESVSRLVLPVSREDNRAVVECKVAHPALEKAISRTTVLNIFCPPVVTASSLAPSSALTEGDSLTLTCHAESNPPASLSWRRMGREAEFLGSAASLALGRSPGAPPAPTSAPPRTSWASASPRPSCSRWSSGR